VVLTAAFGVALARRAATRLAQPFEAVAQAARHVANGQLGTRAQVGRSRVAEIDDLVESFNRMAERLEGTDRELRESTAAVAHELRTPLTILMGRIKGLQEGVFPADERVLAGMLRHVETLARIIEDLRVVSLASNAKLSLNVEPFDMAEECEDFLATLAEELVDRGITLERDLQAAQVRADRIRIRQMLLCLVDNAEKYAATGRQLRVETFQRDDFCVIRVMDRGPGFPPDTGNRVFERFWRGSVDQESSPAGSGLGLAVVKAIAVAHGGSVRASNRDGGGASVEVDLPIVSSQTPTNAA
jgi:signal transduction histidine kinase